MYILGLHGAGLWVHDPAACLVKDGKVIAAAEEERFTRQKHATGQLPVNAVRFCLDYAGITAADLDHVAVGWGEPKTYLVERPLHDLIVDPWHLKMKFLVENLKQARRFIVNGSKFFRNELQDFHGKPSFVKHHIGHAASAWRCSGFGDAAIMTFDMRGETTCTFEGIGNSGGIDVVKEFEWPHSLGLMYGAFTEFLGYKMSDGEGKIMGMAPYGKAVHELSKFVEIDTEAKSYKLKLKNFYGIRHFGKKFVELFGKPRQPDGKIEKYADVAASVQKKLEEIGVMLAADLHDKAGSGNLCLAGGVALNCVMNGRILQEAGFRNVYIQPAAHDAGTAIGAALEMYARLGGKRKYVMETAYHGPEFSDEKIEKVLKKAGAKFEKHKDIAGKVAELLAKDKVVGWFQGRMEIGPRALGNRSILANPCKRENWKRVNDIKKRELWRPFAPSLLDKAKDEYLEDAYKSPFMLLSFFVKEKKRKEIPAVVHVDGSTRPQTVEKVQNPLYFGLIREFESLSGVPVVLNTSFNLRGEPIVNTPAEAVNDFMQTKMDYLAIGNFLVKK